MSSLTRSEMKDLATTLMMSKLSKSHVDELEVEKTIGIILSIKKMISRFLTSGIINDKLMVNNIVIVFNFFGAEITRLLFKSSCTEDQMGVVKSVMKFLRIYAEQDEIETNRVIDGILKDYQIRYHIGG